MPEPTRRQLAVTTVELTGHGAPPPAVSGIVLRGDIPADPLGSG
ncbi:hypothetical protein [Streptomyces litmocidini]|uniref:Uncharacterized protein n=1 Tax=Streptomyces litmocidini TaxID=67318 RepID=A0ABW7UHE4_9ACTN